MYEAYTRQALPSKQYRELLGSAICVFNANNAFVIENILCIDTESRYNWYDLIDMTSGKLKGPMAKTITKKAGSDIAELFTNLVKKGIGLFTAFKLRIRMGINDLLQKNNNIQYVTAEEYLLGFIRDNQVLCSALHKLSGN